MIQLTYLKTFFILPLGEKEKKPNKGEIQKFTDKF